MKAPAPAAATDPRIKLYKGPPQPGPFFLALPGASHNLGPMHKQDMHPKVTAVLGPTNTGKTFFAIERMLAHKCGMIGLPLRLLAREV